MDWIEVSGRTVEEAVAAAAAQLGVDPSAIEHEVIEAGKPGLFGRTRVDARIRARAGAPRRSRGRVTRPASRAGNGSSSEGSGSTGERPAPPPRRARRTPDRDTPRDTPRDAQRDAARDTQRDSVDQAAVAEEAIRFLNGLFEVIDVEVTISWRPIDDETLQVEVTGPNLGFLVGRGGQTLQAIQDLARLRIHHALGVRSGRLMLDIAGYREKRKVALEQFTDRVADEVLRSGERRAMEPMNAVDRKVIHNRVGSIAGVRSESEGEEPDRRVVLLPA